MAVETMELAGKREGSAAGPERIRGGQVYSPSVDIIEMANELLLIADVPRARPDSLDINCEQGLLTVHAKIEPPHEEENTDFLLREYGVGDYYRSFEIGEDVDSRKIAAEIKDGVLTLHLPKAEAAKPHKIEVKGA